MTRVIENILWNSRLVIFIPVLIAIIMAFGMIWVTSVDAIALIGDMLRYASQDAATQAKLSINILGSIVNVIDRFLIAAVLFIFAVGIYELFIGKIESAEESEVGKRLLLIKSLDDLKDRLASMILLVLIVKFFQQALNTKYTEVSDLFLLAVSIALVALALFLSGRAKPAR
jgi:uncharacterized membrane protein YqhA